MKAIEHLDRIIKNKGNDSSEWRHLLNELRNEDNK
jgi:hypothetical protein